MESSLQHIPSQAMSRVARFKPKVVEVSKFRPAAVISNIPVSCVPTFPSDQLQVTSLLFHKFLLHVFG